MSRRQIVGIAGLVREKYLTNMVRTVLAEPDQTVDQNIGRRNAVFDEEVNIPSKNPKTGWVTALSVIACLKGLVETLKVGS